MRKWLPEWAVQRLHPEQRYGLRLTLFGIAVMLVTIPFGLLLEQVLNDGPLTKIDASAANHLHDAVRTSAGLVNVLQFVSFLGKPIWFVVLITATCVYLLARSRRRLVAYLITTSVLGGLIDTAVKVAVSRPRPSLEDPVATAFGQSFPSGHAMSSLVVYGALLLVFIPVIAVRFRIWVAGFFCLLVLAIGFSRLALGVHFISDVLGGFALGLGWLSASTAAFSIWRVERARRPVHPTEGLEPEAARDLKP